ncbi:MAG: hypothetical protein PWR12_1214 [Eubacteriaceae bacterium]|nr:hypothetical protein [Eubacteriaceae bacterium]MDK2905138.1 hypothetical protein [Eubacteriaceae bacterium]MDK2937500.1 hypothetical protein [Eubacteriaceae bacterium]MDK2961380.1 hypothetical protein [Eubacteriaceae bacterium]
MAIKNVLTIGVLLALLVSGVSPVMAQNESSVDESIENGVAITGVSGETGKITYSTHVQNVGWQDAVADGEMSGTEGKGLRLEGIKIESGIEGVGVSYSTHVENIGWQEAVTDGNLSGTSGKGLRLEAIRIQLTGENAGNYDVYYRVHAQNVGWMGWASNGADAGTAGYGYRLEGIEIQIVAKGAVAPGSTDDTYRDADAYKDEYASLINQAYDEFIGSLGTYDQYLINYACPYSLFDMDSNGTPELFIKKGKYEAEYRYDVYTFEGGNAVSLGTINCGHTSMYGMTSQADGQLLLCWGHMGYQSVRALYLNNKTITSAVILDEEVSSVDEFYKTDYPVPYAYGNDLALLNNF